MSSRSDHGLGPFALTGEALRVALAQPVASVMTSLIVAVVCGVILSTTGQTVQAEAQVLSRIDDAGTRSIVITDEKGDAGLRPAAVERIAGLSRVDWVIGIGSAVDGRNVVIGAGGTPAPVRTLHGDVPAALAVVGKQPQSGEALAGSEAVATLGLEYPIGAVELTDGTEAVIVGGFTATEPLTFLNRSVLLVPAEADTTPLRSIHVLAARPEDVEPLTTAILAVLDPESASSLSVQTSETLADVRAAVAGELGRFSRSLVLLVLGVGLVLVALTVHGAVTLRRQDFGRRRALGASRAAIVALVAIRNVAVGLVGTGIGVATGVFLVWRWTGAAPRPLFTLAVGILAVLATLAASLLPALVAAYRDPVRVLRVP
ncbi:MAG: ABC transporter permease [Acidimicrobiia bacterium]